MQIHLLEERENSAIKWLRYGRGLLVIFDMDNDGGYEFVVVKRSNKPHIKFPNSAYNVKLFRTTNSQRQLAESGNLRYRSQKLMVLVQRVKSIYCKW